MMDGLKDIPRIGEKMAKRFEEHFGSEDAALEAILGGDIAGISEVEGVGQRYAISLVHEVRAQFEGVTMNDFLKTKEGIDIYERLLDIIKQFSHTSYAKDKLHVYIPYPESRRDKIEAVRRATAGYMETASIMGENKDLISLLSCIKTLDRKYTVPKIRDRAVLTTDSKQYEAAKDVYGDLMDVQLVKGAGEFVDTARGYSHVVAADEKCMLFDLPEDIDPEFIHDIRKVEMWSMVPELEIAFFAKNLSSLESTILMTQMLRSSGISFLEEIEGEDLDELKRSLSLIDSKGDVRAGSDDAIDRLVRISEHVDGCVSAAISAANSALDTCLEQSRLTLSGQDMLKVMNGKMEIKDLLEKELYHSYNNVVKEAKQRIAEELCLEKAELLLLESFFPDEISHPLEVRYEQLYSFKQQISNQIQRKKVQHKRNIAKALSGYRDIVQKMVREALDFDVGFSIGCFAREFGLQMPELIEGSGIAFEEASNLFIKTRHGSVVPIDYSVGRTSRDPDGNNSRVILLSGVNSGGKTSMLELVAQCVILAHMGFPTPAKCLEIGLTEGFYYFGKSKGTLDAGAFETTLIDFSVVANNSPKIVLADELESITEPGASAKIIGGILEMLSENSNSMSVFVSHLAELILENADCPVRVDGIEASGLDSDLNLVVERTPRYNYVAKSTPELIVERLSRRSDGIEQEFYNRLKEKFR
ncbi:helix-hairpin-helix domain-containing protein [Methanococcoides sp. FTZ1]|uniref:helix-hairpin-helix domain-containing protein n=1 Tax=Methanococcoides sp. FTZ1 TaxID=3439061 RepID=UPI003F85CA4A